MNCARTQQMLDAWVDRELDSATGADLEAHLASCAACAALRSQRGALAAALRESLPYHRAPAALRARVASALEALERPPRARRPTWWHAAGVAACAALLSALLTYWSVRPAADDPVREQLVASHVASLAEPRHLITVASSDRHTVKPWFQGKVDFAPAVKDLSAEGFELLGARLDHVGDRQAAALVYRIRQHVINVFVWRTGGAAEAPVKIRTRGFTIILWTEDGLRYSAISDVDPRDLRRFADLIYAYQPLPAHPVR
jgi:anti-sigma factor RsiW